VVTVKRWDPTEHMDTEERIKGFLEAVLEEGGIDAMPSALAEAAKARAINQLAKETGVDRLELCRMFAQGGEAPPPSPESIARVAQAFAVPAHAGA